MKRLFAILALIGVKLILHAMHENHVPFINDGQPIHVAEISTGVSLVVIVTVLLVTVVASLLSPKGRAQTYVAAAHRHATEFLEIMSLGTFTMFLLMHVTGVMRAVGNSRVPVILMVGANVANVVLDFWFVFGGLGIPAMGVAGAAWATVISRALFAAIGLMLLYVGMKGLRLRRFTWNSGITATTVVSALISKPSTWALAFM